MAEFIKHAPMSTYQQIADIYNKAASTDFKDKMAEVFESPQLGLSEVLEFFAQNDIEVTANDIKRPDPRRWHVFYSYLFEMATGSSIEQAVQGCNRNVHLHTPHPELYEEGFSQMAFTLCMQRVLVCCGFEGFQIRDVISPTQPRLLKMLSAFINFNNHTSLRRTHFEKEKEMIERSRESYESVQNRNKELTKRLSKMNEAQEHRDIEKKKCEEEFDQGNKRIVELQLQTKNDRKTMEENKLDLSEQERQKKEIEQKIFECQQDCEKMSNKIVHSPERFKQEQDRLMKRVSELKDEVSKKEQILSENRHLLERTRGKRIGAEKAVKLGIEVQEAIDKENEVESELQSLTERHNELIEAGSQQFKQEEDLRQKLSVRGEQKRHILVQTNGNKQEQHHKLAEYKQLFDKTVQSIRNEKAHVEELRKELSSLLLKAKETDELLEQKKYEWQSELDGHISEIKDLNEKANKSFKSIMVD